MKRLLRNIHLWLSIPTGIIISLVCFSGAMLVFEKELTETIDSEVYFVNETNSTPLPLQVLMEKVEQTLPDSVSITGLTISSDPSRAYQVSLSKPRRASIYLNPYTGEVTGGSNRLPFFHTMFRLHRWLLGLASVPNGIAWGKLLTGCSTLFLVFILLSGLLMWLTNRHKSLMDSLVIRVSKGWRRFWHDLHVGGGIYATVFLLAMALMGLTWSFSWYRNAFYSALGVESSDMAKNLSHQQRSNGEVGSHRENHGKLHERSQHLEHQGRSFEGKHAKSDSMTWHTGDAHPHAEEHQHSPYRPWDEVFAEVAQRNQGYQQITLKSEVAEVVPNGRRSLRSTDKYLYDRRTGDITEVKPYSAESRTSKVRNYVYMAHTGSWGGLFTRILAFLAALIGATLPLTGYWLWLRKRKAKGHRR